MPKLDLQCPFCPKTSSRGTGLASHIRGAHPREYPGWTKNRKSGSVVKASSSSPVPTTGGGFDAVVAMLEKQKAVIESALSALRQLEDGATIPGPGSVATATKKKRKGGMTPEGKKRLIAALKQRWAAKKAPAKKSQG